MITMTLKEILHNCNDWNKFCDEQKFDKWVVSGGGEGVKVALTQEEAIRYGVASYSKDPVAELDQGDGGKDIQVYLTEKEIQDLERYGSIIKRINRDS